MAIFIAVILTAAADSRADPPELKILCRDSYLPGVPILVRLDLLDESGNVDLGSWDVDAQLSTNRGDEVRLDPDRVVLRNGRGSALVSIEVLAGSSDLTLTATLDPPRDALQVSRSLSSLEAAATTEVAGTVQGDPAIWEGVVRVTGDVTIPSGSTLRIEPGTLVLLEGVVSGENGADINIEGAVDCAGTADRPVSFTAADPARPWGEIHHDNAAPSTYRYAIFTIAGNSPGGGHTGTGPAIRPQDSAITLEFCSFTDNQGKIMQARGSELIMRHCLLSRSVMGPEIDGTALLMEDSHILEMCGDDDDDGIYLHDQREGQVITLRRCVVASGSDDAIDTLGSEVTIEGCIARDFEDKGISVFHDEVTIRNCLIVGNGVGVSAKTSNNRTVTVNIESSTIVCLQPTADQPEARGIQARNKSGEDEAIIVYNVRNSIIWSEDTIQSDYIPDGEEFDPRIHIDYSIVMGEPWPGTANRNLDPAFVDAGARDHMGTTELHEACDDRRRSSDFHLSVDSPAIDGADPRLPADPDGSPADIGYYSFTRDGPPPPEKFSRGLVNDDDFLDIGDPVALLLHLFLGRPLSCSDSADIDDNGEIETADVVRLLEYLFLNGSHFSYPAPPVCDEDPTEDELGCGSTLCRT